jgi:hypothetical protein
LLFPTLSIFHHSQRKKYRQCEIWISRTKIATKKKHFLNEEALKKNQIVGTKKKLEALRGGIIYKLFILILGKYFSLKLN